MKEFKDLQFKVHPRVKGGWRAVLRCKNGLSISVIQGFNEIEDIFAPFFFLAGHGCEKPLTDNENEWEIGVFVTGRYLMFHDIPEIEDGVKGHLDKNQISELMKTIQEFKPKLPAIV